MRFFKLFLPVLILAITIGLSIVIILLAKKPHREPLPVEPREVEVMTLKKTAQKPKIETQGFVAPRAEAELAAEVTGRIVKTASKFYKGEFVKSGAILLELENIDYHAALRRAEAQVAEKQFSLAQEQALAEQARKEWELTSDKPATDLTLRLPQLREAEVSLVAAKAEKEKAQRDLERTQVKAPFDALIFEKYVEVGEYVTPGTRLATLYAVDFAEVRLPLADDDLQFIALPGYGSLKNKPVNVTLKGRSRGNDHHWQGQLIRTENVIDKQTLSLYGIVHVSDPYALNESTRHEPLPIGLFVNALVETQPIEDLFAIPRKAIRHPDQVVLVDENKTIQIRKIEPIYSNRDFVYVTNGLETGELLCLTATQTVLEGERVEVLSSNDTE